jgi:general secretion pathway protein K
MRTDKGFILVLVLWATIFLALMAAGFSATVRGHIRATSSMMDLARAEALADGGVNLALLDLATASQSRDFERRFPAGSSAIGCEADGNAVLAIRIEDETEKLNLNLANEHQLITFLTSNGAPSDQVAHYAASILDFRDSDDDARLGGSERAAYAAVGALVPPKNAPFDTVDELDQVAGLPSDLLDRAKAKATVYSGAYSVYAQARMPSGVTYVTHAIAEFPSRVKADYTLRQWRRGSAGDPALWPVSDAVALPPC